VTTYHVKVTGDDGTGTGTEGNPWREISFALTQVAAGSTAFDSSADEILVWYDATLTYTGNWTAVTTQGVPVIGVDSTGIRWDNGLHWSTGQDDQFGLYVRQERPTVVASTGAVINHYQWQSWYGLDLDGQSGSGKGVTGSGTQEMKFVDCVIRDTGAVAVDNIGANSLFYRPIIHDCSGDIFNSASVNIDVSGGLFYDNTGVLTLTNTGCLVEACTLWGNGSGSGTACNVSSASSTCRNVICQDNSTDYGFPTTPTLTDCNSYTSDSGSFHTTSNYNGVPAAGNTEVDSVFVDSAAKDFHLLDSSTLVDAGATVTEIDHDVDFFLFDSDPSVGAYQQVYIPSFDSIVFVDQWGIPDQFSSFTSFTSSSSTNAGRVYVNRKKHSGGTYHTWLSYGEPDAGMEFTTPPNPKDEYSDHVVLKIRLES
jgi:hypothetical protein